MEGLGIDKTINLFFLLLEQAKANSINQKIHLDCDLNLVSLPTSALSLN